MITYMYVRFTEGDYFQNAWWGGGGGGSEEVIALHSVANNIDNLFIFGIKRISIGKCKNT